MIMMTMMGQKNLHELLEQDQEPFHLKNYIADRRSLLKNHLRRRPKHGGVLQISEPTAAVLLEAATRIHNQSAKPKPKPKSEVKKVSAGIFDSIFKRFGNRSRKDRTFVQKSRGNAIDAGNSRRWSEKSLDLETCCSSNSLSSEENIPATEKEGTVQSFCSSPESPFRFSLLHTPEFSSLEVSPGRSSKQGNEIHEAKTIENYDHQVEVEIEVQEEDEKEQCSPVSVLEPRFQDEEEDKDDNFEPEMECSYATMQKAKHQLLEKLRRFERLAQLDPFELDKTLFEVEDDEIIDVEEDEEEYCFFMDVIIEKSGVDGIKRLVSDLITEEEMGEEKEEEVTKRVCMRLEKWKESKRESIDMMVEMDLRREQIDGWKKIDERQVKEVGKEIGLEILGDLIEELLQDQLIVLC